MSDLPRVIEINGAKYHREPGVPLSEEATRLLSEVYGALWMEACMDPDSEGSQKFAQKHVDKMKRLNELLGFKR